MSRTKRCKNYVVENNTTWDRRGKKVALEYTEDDTPYEETGRMVQTTFYEMVMRGGVTDWVPKVGPKRPERVARTIEYRPMDKGERWWKDRMMHGESSTANSRSPSHWHRLNRQKQNRSINKQEMLKWLKANGEYEPMFEDNPRDCWWDWS